MKKTKMLALSLIVGFQMLATFAFADGAHRCSVEVDKYTTVNYSWQDGGKTATASVKVKGIEVKTYALAIEDVPCKG
jgi:hypothetical protein